MEKHLHALECSLVGGAYLSAKQKAKYTYITSFKSSL